MLLAGTYVGVFTFISTELLSLSHALAFWGVTLTWALACAGLAVAVGRQGIFLAFSRKGTSPEFGHLERWMLVYLVVVLVVTAVLAAWAPPNTWDSMTYHMSRVVHWMQNGSIAFYPTAILRQLHSNPWAEYAILHAQILSGGDRFANFVQWLSMAGSLVGTSTLAREFGADRRGQILTAVACASIPMGILQSTSTQTDYVAAFWLVCFAYFLVKVLKGADSTHFVGMGLALGLSILSKGTAYIFAFPFVFIVTAAVVARGERKKLKLLTVSFGLAFLLNVSHWSRNYALYGSPLGPGSESGGYVLTNDTFSPAAAASNMARNAGLHLGTTSPANEMVQGAVAKFHELIGISLNDPRTTWLGTNFQVTPMFLNEDLAGNPLHLLLIGAACLAYAMFRGRRDPLVTAYVLGLIAAYLAFCWSLRWQPWNSRLHLPIFVMWTPFLGWLTCRFGDARTAGVFAAGLMIGSLPALVWSERKPLISGKSVFTVPRDQQYFVTRPELFLPYRDAVRVMLSSDCLRIGLMLDGDDWEYPVWVFVPKDRRSAVRIEHIAVANVSARLDAEPRTINTAPCAIFRTGAALPTEFSSDGVTYRRAWEAASVNVYIRAR
jgi:hypothetical protein